MNNEKLLTPDEVCEILNIKMSKFRSAIYKKEIPSLRIGRLVRISKIDLENWIIKARLQELQE